MSGKNNSDSVCVLIADDDAVTRRLLKHHLAEAGHRIIEAADGQEAMERMNDEVEVALLDLQMPRTSGMDCLKFVREKHPDIQVMMISGRGEISDAVAAMKQGAIDYITKPFEPDELIAHVQQAARNARLSRDNRGLRQAVSSPMPEVSIVAESPAAKGLLVQLEKIAGLDSTVLLTGDCGTGKTTLARLMHQLSPRAEHPFVPVSCAALPRDLIEAELFGHERGAFTGAHEERAGRVEIADKGTLFLDEIGDLPRELQPKLLTFLQERTFYRIGGNKLRKVDVRVITATNQDLPKMVADNLFRGDLFHRLNLPLHVPSLAERGPDILPLTEQILDRIARQRGTSSYNLSEPAKRALLGYSWPGNIRELENVLERATAFASNSEIQEHDLIFSPHAPPLPAGAPAGGSAPLSLAGMTLEEIEKQAITQTLQDCEGNRAEAARKLGISERTIYNKIKKLDIKE